MIWLFAFIGCLVLLLAYLLFAPLVLEISTSKNLLRLSVHRLAKARLVLGEDALLIELKVPGWTRSFDLLAPRERKPEKVKLKKKKNKRRSMPFRKIQAVLRSFRCKGYATIDTGSMPANGLLYPVFLLLQRRGIPVAINFHDEQSIELEIRNSAARLVWAYVSS
jgi:hypothetical protein